MRPGPRREWHELWGTFSVRDHLRPGAFIAEVMLYDKLVIPVLPTERDGLSPVEASAELARWEQQGWDPVRQQCVVALLMDRAERVPWTAERQAEWRETMARGFANARRDGYFASGSVLQRFAPAMAQTVVAVSAHYSLDELRRDAMIRRREAHDRLGEGAILAALGHELVLPGDPDRDDDELLRLAVAVAGDERYRRRRRALYEWQQRFVNSDGITDERSIRAAVKEMAELVDELKTATEQQERWRWTKRIFSFLRIGASVGSLVPSLAAASATGEVVASIGEFVADQSDRGALADAIAVPAATLILNAGERLRDA